MPEEPEAAQAVLALAIAQARAPAGDPRPTKAATDVIEEASEILRLLREHGYSIVRLPIE